MPTQRPTPTQTTAAWQERAATLREAAQAMGFPPLAQVQLLEELAKGDPVSQERASELLELSVEAIAELFLAIGAFGGQLNDEGELLGMMLTLEPTRHQFRVNGNDLYAWCSLDTILLPGILEATGKIESTDPYTGETIRLTVTADRIIEVDPPGAVTSIFVPGRAPTETADGQAVVGADSVVCKSMLFYASRESAEQALESYPNIAILTVEEAFDLARETSTEPTRALRRQPN